MDLDRDASASEGYYVTAVQIFDYCCADSSATIQVDELMDKLAPFVKTDKKSECSFLKSLLDPEQTNPEINVMKLAKALAQFFGESHQGKVDLDESFNLRTGPIPKDSDSGISTDGGFQILEDLQCELREKCHLAQQLRSQLDFSSSQHEEALASLTAERDSLRAHLNIIREENLQLSHIRHDYEDACDRLCSSERAVDDARKEIDALRKRNRVLDDELGAMETKKSTLEEQLMKSKEECHRINEMYSSRQLALREENETLKTERADLAARLQDHEELMQQVLKEKAILEMELKDILNKSNQTQLRLDRSIDVSYTDDHMLTALDPLNADSCFTPENRILDEESFVLALKEDQGRASHMSLFDEIRLSFCNLSRQSFVDSDSQCEKCSNNSDNDNSRSTGTQTDEVNQKDATTCECSKEANIPKCLQISKIHSENIPSSLPIQESKNTQTNTSFIDNNNCGDCLKKCLQCESLTKYTTKLESDLKHSKSNLKDVQTDLDKYESNLLILQQYLEEGDSRNNLLQTVVNSLQSKIGLLEATCTDQMDKIDRLSCDTCVAGCQTEFDYASVSTQAEAPCFECEKRVTSVPNKSLRKYLWEPLKCLFQVFAIVCFVCAVSVLYGVTRRWNARCVRETAPVPWRWFDAQEFMDLLLRMEYVADIPM